MAKTKAQKIVEVKSYRARIAANRDLYVVKPIKMNPNQATTLKKELAKLDSSFNIVKNTLFKIALKEENLPELEFIAKGEHGILFSGVELTETAKVLTKFATDTKSVEILGGIIDGKAILASDIKRLAELPSRDGLLAQLLSVMNGPMRGLVTVMNGNMRQFVYLLNAVKEAKTA